MVRLGLAVALGLTTSLTVGCAGVNPPFEKATKEKMVQRSAARGYTEIRRGKEIFVASTYDGVKRIRTGKEPVVKLAAIGFGPNGEKVVFEASKDGALEKALMAEFDRRHGRQQDQADGQTVSAG